MNNKKNINSRHQKCRFRHPIYIEGNIFGVKIRKTKKVCVCVT